MVIEISARDMAKNITFEGFLSEANYQGMSTVARIETQANGGILIVVKEEDEFGHDYWTRIALDPDDIATINKVKR